MHNELLLGKSTEYKSTYDASLLFPIPREENRQRLPGKAVTFYGVDVWNAYEVSWLNAKGKPQVAVAEFRIPADSTNIIESKSFKLYLNSFNQSRYEAWSQVNLLMQQDLSAVAGAEVQVELQAVNVSGGFDLLSGDCIDDIDMEMNQYEPDAALLQCNPEAPVIEKTLVSHLLKSNCPVTHQPDWASVQVSYRGPEIDESSLLAYIVSYREHSDFHEHCVESIFTDIRQRCNPEYLKVYARYTRRGGLDINPVRCSDQMDSVSNPRLIRQ